MHKKLNRPQKNELKIKKGNKNRHKIKKKGGGKVKKDK